MNHYDILEVSKNASKEVIKAAYKSLMQRYHPDRNPGDADVAERAVRVAQAYEVLSDPELRAEYDKNLELQLPEPSVSAQGKAATASARPAGGRRTPARKSGSSWYIWVLILIILGSGWFILSRNKSSLPPELELKQLRLELADPALTPTQIQVKLKRQEEILRRHPSIQQKELQEKSVSENSRILPDYLSDLTVRLKIEDLSYLLADAKPSPNTQQNEIAEQKNLLPLKVYKESGRVLYIPELTIKIGTHDADNVLKHLESKKELIGQKLGEKLAMAQYDELLKVSGERYLVEMILDSIGETTGTDRHKEYPATEFESPARYGVIEVSLPASYSVN